MACGGFYRWSLSDLVGAFVDLAIAYLLLCASAVAFTASKLLGLFGLCLPCPCTVLGTFCSNYCVQSFLVDCPSQKVLNVLLFVRKRFPFSSHLGEGSCSSVSGGRRGRVDWDRGERVDGSVGGERGVDVKGKGVMNGRARGWVRARRRGARNGRDPLLASCDPQRGDVFGCYSSSLSDRISKGGLEMLEDVIGCSDNAIDTCYVDGNQASSVVVLGERDAILADEFPDENDEEEKLSSSMVAMAEPSQNFASSCGDKHAVKILEQELRKEQAARRALYIELEKERSAAASAADEAMAMILHLQDEKATVEMEARQYQRIIEEKSAYDAEEMNVLKDILLIRERENHSLVKEVEEYRQMISLFKEQVQEDPVEFEKKHIDPLVDPSEDLVFSVDQPSASWIEEKMSRKDMQTSACSRNREQNVQEKQIIPICGHLYVPAQHEQSQVSTTITCETSSSHEHNFSEKRIHVSWEENIQDGQGILEDKMDFFGTTDPHIPRRENLEKQDVGAFDEVKKSVVVMFDKEPEVHDIHVIVDEPGLPDEHARKQRSNHW